MILAKSLIVLFAVAGSLLGTLFTFLWLRKRAAKAAINRAPKQIKLKSAPSIKWEDQEMMQALLAPFVPRGFRDLGSFTIVELPKVRLQMFVHQTENVLAVAYEIERGSHWVEISSYYADKTTMIPVVYTTSNTPQPQRPGAIRVIAGGISPGALYTRFMEERPKRKPLSVTPGTAGQIFEEAYALEAGWRKTANEAPVGFAYDSRVPPPRRKTKATPPDEATLRALATPDPDPQKHADGDTAMAGANMDLHDAEDVPTAAVAEKASMRPPLTLVPDEPPTAEEEPVAYAESPPSIPPGRQSLINAGLAGPNSVPPAFMSLPPGPNSMPTGPSSVPPGAKSVIIPLSHEAAMLRIRGAVELGTIKEGLLGFAQTLASRAILFRIRGGVVRGWEGAGDVQPRDTIRQIAVPLSDPSTFRKVAQSRLPHTGEFDAPGDTSFLEQMGFPDTAGSALIPVLLHNRVVFFLYLETGDGQPVGDLGDLINLIVACTAPLERITRKPEAKSG